MPSPVAIAAYRLEGDHVIPTEYARGPWFGDQQHGASLLGLLARFLERVPSATPMRLTRISADLSRPVPMLPFSVTARAIRDGRRVQSLVAELSIDGQALARAVATRIRFQAGLVPSDRLRPPPPADQPPDFPPEPTALGGALPCFHDCLEVRGLDAADAAVVRRWFRLAHPLVFGEEPSPTVRLASVADMIVSCGEFIGADWISINPEVTLQIERLPVGEWIGTSSEARFGDDGIGMSEGVLFDRTGRVGRSAKSTLNDRR
jgi:Thioesterase-like superfamily